MSPMLHTYQCANCGTVAVAAHKAHYGDPYRCVLCRSMMRYQWSLPIVTREQRAWAARGIVYNPHVTRDVA